MACRGCLECLLKLLNFLLTLVGLAMVGYGIYLLVEWKRASDYMSSISSTSDNHEFVQLGRPMLLAVSLSTSILDKLSKACTSFPSNAIGTVFGSLEKKILLQRFIYVFIAVGVILFVISCFGCIGAITRNGCCLTCYSVLVILLILVELGCAAFIFFDHSWEDAIPTDKTGDFEMIYSFLKENWKIAKWVALGAVILEALVFLLALLVRAMNRPVDHDSDDEYIAPRQGIQQPLINRQGVPATGGPVAGALDQRSGRNDAWSTRMREKYGLDSSEANRLQPVAAQPAEERSRCTIM
ncbi:hypothetical protein HHK36_000488 [Tetracentron sinense]|uniref:Tobamovirus multiplication protein 2A n=1 Tax=Tetracentron sinense TaxID=13715 RepID=A0A834ZS02_TETSI|nr:hypothetical protein HHK36_000488 [Tetracentron sinense]